MLGEHLITFIERGTLRSHAAFPFHCVIIAFATGVRNVLHRRDSRSGQHANTCNGCWPHDLLCVVLHHGTCSCLRAELSIDLLLFS
jgi:hypothetical protein